MRRTRGMATESLLINQDFWKSFLLFLLDKNFTTEETTKKRARPNIQSGKGGEMIISNSKE